jgi:hypothetical protein
MVLNLLKSAPYIINVSSEKEDFEILYKEEIYDLKRQGEKILLQAIESEVIFKIFQESSFFFDILNA